MTHAGFVRVDGMTGTEIVRRDDADAANGLSTSYRIGVDPFFYGRLSRTSDVDGIAVTLTAGVHYASAALGIGALDSQLNAPLDDPAPRQRHRACEP